MSLHFDDHDFDLKEAAEKFKPVIEKDTELLSSDTRAKYEENASLHWDKYYKDNKTKSYQKRNYLDREFTELSSNVANQQTVVLEIGCGIGSTSLPLIRSNPNIYFHCCDLSSVAIDILRSSSEFDPQRCNPFVCDITQSGSLNQHIKLPVDLVTLIFVLSAVPPQKMKAAISQIYQILKPGGKILFRDYGIYDEAQLRFATKHGQKLDQNFYVKHDGTMVKFFPKEELAELFQSEGFQVEEMKYCTSKVTNTLKKESIYRVWIHAKFVKPAEAKPQLPEVNNNNNPISAVYHPVCHGYDHLIEKLQTVFDLSTLNDMILNLYQWGSRVYGTCTPESDFDFIMIIKDEFEELVCQKIKPVLNLSFESVFPVFVDADINVTIIPLEKFKIMMMEHRHQAVEVYFLPKQFVWVEKNKVELEFDHAVLRRTVSWESKRRFQIAKSKLKHNDLKNAKKHFVHSIRYLLFAEQILSRGKIDNYGVANDLWQEIVPHPIDWEKNIKIFNQYTEDFKLFYRNLHDARHFYSHYDTTKEQLLKAIQKNKTKSLAHLKPSQHATHSYPTRIQQFVAEHGLQQLEAKYDALMALPVGKSLVHIFVKPYNCGDKSSVSEVGLFLNNFVILDCHDNYNIVCCNTEHQVSLMEYNPTTDDTPVFLEDYDGVHVTLYYHNQEWQLSTLFDSPSEWKVCAADEKHACSLESLFWKLWNTNNYALPQSDRISGNNLSVRACFKFAVLSPKNRYIVNHPEALVLLNVFDLDTGKQLDWNLCVQISVCGFLKCTDFQEQYHWLCAKQYPELKTIQEAIELVKGYNPFVHKGLIARYPHVDVQVTAPYFASSELSSDTTSDAYVCVNIVVNPQPKDLLHLIRACKDNFVYWNSAVQQEYLMWKNLYKDAIRTFEEEYTTLTALNDQKQFALQAQASVWETILFWIQRGYYNNVAECFYCLDLLKLEHYLDRYRKHLLRGHTNENNQSTTS